ATNAAAGLLYPHLVRLPIPQSTATPAPAFHDPTEAWRFLDIERPNLVAAIRHAAEQGPRPAAWQLADATAGYFFHRRHAIDWLATGHHALAAAQDAGDATGQAVANLILGQALTSVADHSSALQHYERALAHSRRAGWSTGEINTLNK